MHIESCDKGNGCCCFDCSCPPPCIGLGAFVGFSGQAGFCHFAAKHRIVTPGRVSAPGGAFKQALPEAESPKQARVYDWKALIEAKVGACRLRIEELLEEQRANAD